MIDFKKKIYLLVATCLLAVILIVLFIVIPTIDDIENLNQGIQDQLLAIERRYLQLRGAKRTIDLNKIKADTSKLSAIFVQKNQELEFITTLESLATKNNLEQQIQLNPRSTNLLETIKITPIQITLSGDFLDTLKYLSDLEKLNYYINLNSFFFNAIGPKENIPLSPKNLGRVNVIIKGESYWE